MLKSSGITKLVEFIILFWEGLKCKPVPCWSTYASGQSSGLPARPADFWYAPVQTQTVGFQSKHGERKQSGGCLVFFFFLNSSLIYYEIADIVCGHVQTFFWGCEKQRGREWEGGKRIRSIHSCFQYSVLLGCDYPGEPGFSQSGSRRGEATASQNPKISFSRFQNVKDPLRNSDIFFLNSLHFTTTPFCIIVE